MVTLLKYLARHIRRRRVKTILATWLLPLSSIKRVAVWVDGSSSDVVDVVNEIHAFFGPRGKKVKVYCLNLNENKYFREDIINATFLHKSDINWYGCFKNGKNNPTIDRNIDLFISLYPREHYAIEDALLCSKARMRVGRIPSKLYDFTISGAENNTDIEIFRMITNLLTIIK